MLKMCSPFIDKFLTHIINCCLETGYYPHIWKVAIGKPLAKCSNPKQYSDLRIISILPTISKLIERVMYSQMEQYFLDNKLISDNQAGFRKGFNTAHTLATVLDDISEAWDNGKVSALALLDFSTAFDTVNHELLFTLHYITILWFL